MENIKRKERKFVEMKLERKSYWIKAHKSTMDVIYLRARQLGLSQEQLIGHILKDWSSKSTVNDENYQRIKSMVD